MKNGECRAKQPDIYFRDRRVLGQRAVGIYCRDVLIYQYNMCVVILVVAIKSRIAAHAWSDDIILTNMKGKALRKTDESLRVPRSECNVMFIYMDA